MYSRFLAIILVSMYSAATSAQTVSLNYCDGDGCPTKFTVEGFEVRVATSVFEASDFSHGRLGQALDVLQSRLIAFEQMARRKNSARLAIR